MEIKNLFRSTPAELVEAGARLPSLWLEIGNALRDIGFTGNVVMEPFVLQGGAIGREINAWRDFSDNADEAALDRTAQKALWPSPVM